MKLKVYFSTNRIGSEVEDVIEIAAADIDGMTEEEKAKFANEELQRWVWENLDAYYEWMDK